MSNAKAPFNVFCSYAHQDESHLQKLKTHLSGLERQGLISAWYDRQIPVGTDWAEAIDTHLETASLILLLVTANFLASDYCYKIEMERAMQRHEAKVARVFPIIVSPCDWHHTPLARLQSLPRDGEPITTWENQEVAWHDVAAGIRRAIEDLPLLVASAPHAELPAIWNIPYPRNPFFIGRDELLVRLHTQLQAGRTMAISQPQAISGLGGIGKTQMAVEYAYRYHQEYEVVLWARAENQETLISSYTIIATLLNLSEREAAEQEMVIGAVKKWLQTHRRWLLILDNADEPELLLPFLPPQPGGHLLVTTRASDLTDLGLGFTHSLSVETFTPEDGARFLLHRVGRALTLDEATPSDRTQAQRISKALGGLPLALDQAGAYMKATESSLESYEQIYQQHRLRVLKVRQGREHPEPVATTWSLSFQRVEEKNAAAADLLRLCTYLSPDAIAEEILTEGAPVLGSVLESTVSDPLLLSQAIEALRAYSLVGRDPRAKTLSMHRLVQAVLQDEMDEQSRKQWAERAVRAVNKAFPHVEHRTWPQCDRLLPHALHCAAWIEEHQLTFPEVARLLNQTGSYLEERARYGEAEPLYLRALQISEQQLGAQHPATATSLNNLAALYRSQGKYSEAEPLYLRALQISEHLLGAEHPDTAQSLNNLAYLYQSQKKYAEAEGLYKRALSIYEQKLGSLHPDTQIIRGNYTILLRAMGRNAEADTLEGK